MGAYQYPQIPRSSRTQIDTTPQQQNPASRFSWVATPAEAKAYTWQRNGINESSAIPPLPQVPEHLHSSPPQQIANTVSRAEQQPALPPVQSNQPSIPQQPAPAYTPSEHPIAQHYTSGPTPYARQVEPPYQLQTQQPPAPPPTHDRQYSQDTKPIHTMQYTQMPPPAKQPTHPSNQPTFSIAPDENPLSPTTPTKSHHHHHASTQSPINATNTTNLPILPPTHPSSSTPHPFPPTTTTSHHTPTGPLHGGPYHHSLLSCLPLPTCLLSLTCPCITYGRTQHRLSQRAARHDPTNMLGYRACNASCVAFALLCGFNLGLVVIQRRRVRRGYGVVEAASDGGKEQEEEGRGEGQGKKASLGRDVLLGTACCCCVLAQDEKEVRWREEEGRRGAGGANEGYVPVGGMRFEPPPSGR